MNPKLQGQVHLLAVLLSAFTLLSVPMFMQLREDSADAVPKAKSTVLSQWFAKLAKQLKDQKLDDKEQVEDYWGQQAQKNNPNCGANCDPNGDLDGDGMSNADEVRQGRNPACNEEKYGDDYCKGADRFNVTTPPPDVTARRDLLLDRTFVYSSGSTLSESFAANYNYTRIDVYVNASGYQGIKWQVIVDPPSGTPGGCAVPGDANPHLTATLFPMQTCDWTDARAGTHAARVDTTAVAGQWNVRVYGVLNGS